MPKLTQTVTLAISLILLGQNALAEEASAELIDTDGKSVGIVEFRSTPHGTLLRTELHSISPGTHAFHIHEIGQCDPDFGHAGGHYNPEAVGHGLFDDSGFHVGDMPNLHVPENGALTVEILNHQLALDERLFDDDGAAIMIHAGPDDYTSDPAGAAGDRIACGVIVSDN